MTHKREVIVGAFRDPQSARRAIAALRDAGYSSNDIGLITHNRKGEEEVASFRELETSKAKKGAVAGVAAGAGTGVLWALGIAAGVLPAIGPVIAGGILGALAASTAAGAAAGGVVGALVGAGIPDEEAAYYADEFRRGSTIVVVRTDGSYEQILRFMREHDVYHRPTVGQQQSSAHAHA